MGVLSWPALLSHKLSVPPSGETMPQTSKIFEVQEGARGPLSPYQVWWGSDFTRRRGSQKRWVFLSVCSSRFWTSEIVRPISPWRRWSTETVLMPLNRGSFVVVHTCSTLSDCFQLATSLNAEIQKISKNWGFSPTEGNRINRSRRNLARKRIPWVCYSTPNLALIGQRGSIQEPPKSQNLPKIVVFGHRKPTQ